MNAEDSVFNFDAGLDSIGRSAGWLRDRLTELGVSLHSDSELARALAVLADFGSRAQRGDPFRFTSSAEAAAYLGPAIGADFLTKILHRGSELGVAGFDERLPRVASAMPLPTVRSASNVNRDTIWELVIASAVATFADDTALEEPDVTCSFEDERIGLAAKVIYSQRDDQRVRVIKEGAEQVQDARVDAGFVVLNLVQVYPAAEMLAHFRRARLEDPQATVEIVDQWATTFVGNLNLDALARTLKRCNKVRSIVSFIPALVLIHGMPSPMYRVSITSINGREQSASPFEQAFNAAFQRVLAFAPRSLAADEKGAQ